MRSPVHADSAVSVTVTVSCVISTHGKMKLDVVDILAITCMA